MGYVRHGAIPSIHIVHNLCRLSASRAWETRHWLFLEGSFCRCWICTSCDVFTVKCLGASRSFPLRFSSSFKIFIHSCQLPEVMMMRRSRWWSGQRSQEYWWTHAYMYRNKKIKRRDTPCTCMWLSLLQCLSTLGSTIPTSPLSFMHFYVNAMNWYYVHKCIWWYATYTYMCTHLGSWRCASFFAW